MPKARRRCPTQRPAPNRPEPGWNSKPSREHQPTGSTKSARSWALPSHLLQNLAPETHRAADLRRDDGPSGHRTRPSLTCGRQPLPCGGRRLPLAGLGHQALSLDLAEATPDAVRLPDVDRVVQAWPLHRAGPTDLLGSDLAADLLFLTFECPRRKEHRRLRTPTCSSELPVVFDSLSTHRKSPFRCKRT